MCCGQYYFEAVADRWQHNVSDVISHPGCQLIALFVDVGTNVVKMVVCNVSYSVVEKTIRLVT